VTGQQRMLTPPLHLIPPLVYPEARVYPVLRSVFPTGFIRLVTVCYFMVTKILSDICLKIMSTRICENDFTEMACVMKFTNCLILYKQIEIQESNVNCSFIYIQKLVLPMFHSINNVARY
jgi:hypothetical protein